MIFETSRQIYHVSTLRNYLKEFIVFTNMKSTSKRMARVPQPEPICSLSRYRADKVKKERTHIG